MQNYDFLLMSFIFLFASHYSSFLRALSLDYDIQCIIHNPLLYIIPKFDKYAVYVFSFIVNQNFNKKTKHFILNTQIHGDISQKVTHLLINIICIKTAINLVFHSVLWVQLEIFFILLSSLIYKYSKSVKIRSFSYNWCMRTIWTYKTYFFIKVFSCNLMVCSWISVRI